MAGVGAVATAALLGSRGSEAATAPRRGSEGAPSTELVVLQIGSGRSSVLTHGDYALDRPAWSRSGDAVDVVRQHCASCRRVLVSVQARGGHALRRIELPPLGGREPTGRIAWKRTGASGALAAADAEGERVIAVVRGRHARVLRGLDDATEPEWSPTGRTLAYTAEFDEVRRIVFERMDVGRRHVWKHAEYSEDQPAWSPGGRRLAFSRLELSMTWDICLSSLDGQRVRCLARSRWNERDPAWSPDGRRIAFASDRGGGPAGTRAIYVVDASGTHLRRMTATSSDSWAPAWSPDGTKLAFVRRRLAAPQ